MFSVAILNPPYLRSKHLEILQETISRDIFTADPLYIK